MSQTSIEWTERTWNPLRGCSRVSDGCRHCYAETIAARFSQPGNTFHGFAERTSEGPRWTGEVVLLKDRLIEPFTWKKPARVFVNSMSDLFHEKLTDEAIDQVFAVMALCPQHTFQVLTKRADRMREYLSYEYRWAQVEGACVDMVGSTNAPAIATPERRSLPNVWLGVSVENQHFADERIPLLLQTPAAVRFISAEPLLGPIDVTCRSRAGGGYVQYLPAPGPPDPPGARKRTGTAYLDWIIVGGESGHGARPLWVPWVRSIVAQCRRSRVKVFVKQLGADVRDRNDAGFTGDFDGSGSCWPEQHAIDDRIKHDLDGTRDGYQGAPVRIHLRSRKGGDPAEWPEDLRVRQMPSVQR